MNICNAAMKVILVTGSTDGIGLEAAKQLVAAGHYVLLHGRSPQKLQAAAAQMASDNFETHVADLSVLAQVDRLARDVAAQHDTIDVLIHNAGIFQTTTTRTRDGLDTRFAVNTFAPYLLTKRLLPLLPQGGRVVNLSSAAQSPVSLAALQGTDPNVGSHFAAYAQSKLALTMWNNALATQHPGIDIIALNPGSMIGTKMVKEGFGVEDGKSLNVGSDIIVEAALSETFAGSSGKYFDNDRGGFGPPHGDALNPAKCQEVVDALETVLKAKGIQ